MSRKDESGFAVVLSGFFWPGFFPATCLYSFVAVTYFGPYIMASVARYPLVNPSRNSATIASESLHNKDGSRRLGILIFDRRNIGTKTSRSTDRNTSRKRLDCAGYKHIRVRMIWLTGMFSVNSTTF